MWPQRQDLGSRRTARGGLPAGVLLLVCATAVATVVLLAVVAEPTLSSKERASVVLGQVHAGDPGRQPRIVDEVVAERTLTSRTWATDDGGRTVRVYPAPIHFRNRNGNLQRIDGDLVASPLAGYALRNAANRYRADLPRDARDPVRFEIDGDAIRFALRGAAGAGREASGVARYDDAMPGVDLVYAPRPMGLKESLLINDRSAPADYVFDVQMPRGMSLRNVRDGVNVVERGRLVARFDPPFAFDGSGGHGDERVERDPHVRLRAEGANVLRLSVDEAWLRDPARVMPIVVDPTISWPGPTARMDGATADTYLSSDSPSTAYGTSAVLAAGWGLNGNTYAHDHRPLLRFDIAGAVPPDSVVFSAQLGMYNHRGENSNLGVLRVRELSRAFTEAATWSTSNGTTAWTTAGGDVTSYASAGIQPVLGWNYWKDLGPLAERWAQGASLNNGLLIERCCGAPDNTYELASTNGSQAQWPYLQVWYTRRSGTLRSYSFWQPGGAVMPGVDADSAGAKGLPEVNVNLATGNLLVRTTDRAGGPGEIDLVRWYNGNWQGFSAFARGWSRDGFDVNLRDTPSGDVRFNGPAYTPILFRRRSDGTFDPGVGLDATLARATDGTTDQEVTLTQTGERFVFGTVRDGPADIRPAKRYVDGAGKATTFTYSTDWLTVTATDSAGRTTTFLRERVTDTSEASGAYRVKEIRSSAGTWRHSYSNDNLVSVTAPDGRVTRYEYTLTSSGTPERKLLKIVTPDGSETRFTYASSSGDQIASHTTRASGATVDGPTTRFAYSAGRTIVTDPSGKATSYYWDTATRRVTRAESGTTPPASTQAGTLYDRRDGTLADDGTKYGLTVTATSSAGIKSIEFLVDGERADYAEQICSGCGMTRAWTFDPEEFPRGQQFVSSVVTSADGATQRRDFQVTVGGSTKGIAATTEDELDETPAGVVSAGVADPPPRFRDPALLEASRGRGATAQLAQAQGTATLTNIFNNIEHAGVGTTGTPPDATGAIGEHDYVQVTNGRIALFDRNNMTAPKYENDDVFMGATDAYDPQVVWDRRDRRFFFAAAAAEGTRNGAAARNYLVFGWSKTSNPDNLSHNRVGGDWCMLRIRQADWGTDQDDYPKLGVSSNFIIIGSNVYDVVPEPDVFRFSRLTVATKPERDDRTSCPNRDRRVRRFDNLVAPATPGTPPWIRDVVWTPVPTASGTPTNPGGHIVSADRRNIDGVEAGTRLFVWRIVGPRGRPTLRDPESQAREVTVPQYGAPPLVPQNDSLPIDTLDPRLWQVIGTTNAVNGQYQLWTSHTVDAPQTDNPNRRAAVRWYQFAPPPRAGGTPLQNGLVDSTQVEGGNTTTSVFNAAISPDRTGLNAVIHYNVARADLPPQIHARSRRSTDPLGTMVGSQRNIRQSAQSLNRDGCVTLTRPDRCRWGDYVGATPDPNVDNVVWGTNMFVGADRTYSTRIFALTAVASTGSPTP